MNHLLNASGYVLDSQELRVLQKEGWVCLKLVEIAEVKKHSFATFEVRLADGKRKSLELAHLGTDSFSAVSEALKNAVHDFHAAAAHP